MKSQKNRFQFYLSFCVVYSLQRYRRFAVYKEPQKKRQKRKPENRFRLFINNTMTETDMKRKQRFLNDSKKWEGVAEISQGVKREIFGGRIFKTTLY